MIQDTPQKVILMHSDIDGSHLELQPTNLRSSHPPANEPKDVPPFIRIIRTMAARGFPTALSYTLSIQYWIIGLMVAYLSDEAINTDSATTMPTTSIATSNQTTQTLYPHKLTTEYSNSEATSPAASAIIMVALNSITYTFFSFLYAENLAGSEIKGFIDLCTNLLELYNQLKTANQDNDKLLVDISTFEDNAKIQKLFASLNKDSNTSAPFSSSPDSSLLEETATSYENTDLATTVNSTHTTEESLLERKKKLLRSTINNQRRELASLNQAGIIAAIPLIPIPMLILGYLDRILLLASVDPEVCEVVGRFMSYYIWALPGFFTRIAAERMLFVLDKELSAMGIGLGSLSIGTAIAGVLGLLTDLAEKGIATGFIVESYLTAAAYIAYACLDESMKPFEFYNFSNLTIEILKKYFIYIFRSGSPFAISFGNEGSVSILLLIYACILGKTALAQLEFQQGVFLFVFLFAAATGHIHYIETSKLVGKEDYVGTTKQAIYGFASTCIFAGAATLTAAAILSIWSAFDSEEDSAGLRSIFSAAVFVDGARYLMLCGQRSMNDNIPSTLISAGGLWAGIIIGGLTLLSESRCIEYIAASYLFGEVLALGGLGTFRFRQFVNPTFLKNHLTKKITPKTSVKKHSIYEMVKRPTTNLTAEEKVELV